MILRTCSRSFRDAENPRFVADAIENNSSFNFLAVGSVTDDLVGIASTSRISSSPTVTVSLPSPFTKKIRLDDTLLHFFKWDDTSEISL